MAPTGQRLVNSRNQVESPQDHGALGGIINVGSVWLKKLESSMKRCRGTYEVSIHEKTLRLKWGISFRQKQLEIPNHLA